MEEASRAKDFFYYKKKGPLLKWAFSTNFDLGYVIHSVSFILASSRALIRQGCIFAKCNEGGVLGGSNTPHVED